MKRLFLLNILIILVSMLTACTLIQDPSNYTNNASTSSKNVSSYKSKSIAHPSSPVDIVIKTESEESEDFSYAIEYPVISNLKDTSKQNQLNLKIKKQVYDYMANIRSSSKSQSKSEFFVPYSATTKFETKTIRPQIISLIGSFSQDTGGAHPNYSIYTYNINVTSGNLISLEDIFVPDFDYKTIINTEIKNQIKKDISDNIYFHEKNLKFVSIRPMQQYYIEDGKLNIQFDVYEIAPYSTGAPSFVIPNSLLTDGLKGEYKELFIKN